MELEDKFYKLHSPNGALLNAVKTVSINGSLRVIVASNSGLQWLEIIESEICVCQVNFPYIPDDYQVFGLYIVQIENDHFYYLTMVPLQSSDYHILGFTINYDEQYTLTMFQDLLIDFNPLEMQYAFKKDSHFMLVLSYDRNLLHCYEMNPANGTLHRRVNRQNIGNMWRRRLGIKSVESQPLKFLLQHSNEGSQCVTGFADGYLSWDREAADQTSAATPQGLTSLSSSSSSYHNHFNSTGDHSNRKTLNVFEEDMYSSTSNGNGNGNGMSLHHLHNSRGGGLPPFKKSSFSILEQINEVNGKTIFDHLFDDKPLLSNSTSSGNLGHGQGGIANEKQSFACSILLSGLVCWISFYKMQSSESQSYSSLLDSIDSLAGNQDKNSFNDLTGSPNSNGCRSKPGLSHLHDVIVVGMSTGSVLVFSLQQDNTLHPTFLNPPCSLEVETSDDNEVPLACPLSPSASDSVTFSTTESDGISKSGAAYSNQQEIVNVDPNANHALTSSSKSDQGQGRGGGLGKDEKNSFDSHLKRNNSLNSNSQYKENDDTTVRHSRSGAAQCIATGDVTLNGINDIIVGYESGLVCVYALTFEPPPSDTTLHQTSKHCKGIGYELIWSKQLHDPIISVSYGRIPDSLSFTEINDLRFTLDQLIVVTTKCFHVFSLR